MKSRAVVLVADRQLELQEIEVPDLPPGFALLKVDGNGICGSDHDLYAGSLRTPLLQLPCVLGHEIVGTVVATTPEAERDMRVVEGDFVAVEGWIRCGKCRACTIGNGNHCENVFNYSGARTDSQPGNGLTGGMADYMLLRPGTSLYRFATEVSVEDAVLHNPLGNGLEWTCRAGQVKLGDDVLIFGGGQRGIACVIAAKESGANRIIVTGLARDKHKLGLAEEFGATDTINIEETDVRERVRDITGGRGADVSIDLAPGATQTILDAIELTRPEGAVVLCGVKGRPMNEVPIDRMRQKGLRIQGTIGVSHWSTEQAVRLIDEQRYPFAKLHTHTFGLEEAERAIKILGNEITGEDPIHITIRP